MGIIYKEVKKGKDINFYEFMILAFLLTIILNLLINSISYSSKYNLEIEIFIILTFLLSLTLIFLIFDLIYSRRICCTYKLIHYELICEKSIGKLKRDLLNINMNNVVMIIPESKSKGLKNIEKTYRFCCKSKKSDLYCCIVKVDNKMIKLLFQPSEELLKKLQLIIH